MRTVEHWEGDVATIALSASSVEIAEAMRAAQVGSLVVMDGKKPVGIVTDRDLLCRVIAAGRDADSTRASDVMSSPLVSVEPDAPLEKFAGAMATNGIRRVPVVHAGKLRGIVSLDDTLGTLSDEFSDLAAGRRRSARAASGRRIHHEVESMIGDLADRLDELGNDARRGVRKRIENVMEKIGLRE